MDAEASLRGGKAKVLLVDDVESLRFLYRRIFKREAADRYEIVAEAADGRQAIELAKQHQPDLVLLDVSMPVMDGMEALPEIVRASPRAKVVMLSGFSAERLGAQAMERGAAHYLEKGVTPKELVRELDGVLGLEPPPPVAVPTPAPKVDASEAYERRIAELQDVNRELEAFSYTVSHDVRAPLRGIGYLAEALEEDATELLPEHKELTRKLRQESDRVSRLVEDLLTLSKVSRGELHIERVDLSAMARETLERLQREQPERRVATYVQDGLSVEGDPDLLRNVMENLLANAWKFTSHEPEARIEVGRIDVEDGEAIFVKDNGAGFDPQRAARLFEPFQRLHDARRYPGTGVGLASVKRVVQRHGGHIWATSKPSAGATFFFTVR